MKDPISDPIRHSLPEHADHTEKGHNVRAEVLKIVADPILGPRYEKGDPTVVAMVEAVYKRAYGGKKGKVNPSGIEIKLDL